MTWDTDDDRARATGLRTRDERLREILDEQRASARLMEDVLNRHDGKLSLQKDLNATLALLCVHLNDLNRDPGERSARAVATVAEQVRRQASELAVLLDGRP